MKSKFFPAFFCIAIALVVFSACEIPADKKNETESIEMMRKDSARLADSAQAEEQRAKDEAESSIKNFDFTGKWNNAPMAIVFQGDSGKFDTGTNDNLWCKVNIDRTKDPMWLEMTKYYKDGHHVIAYSMLLKIMDKNTLRVAFGEDITVRPDAMEQKNTVEFKRE